MALVIGDSYAARLNDLLGPDDHLSAAGMRGARVCQEQFRHWALREAVALKPRVAMLLIGGNDLACPEFRQRNFIRNLRELALGLLAAGAERVFLFPIPPRDTFRRQDARPEQYRRRRRLTNRILKATFKRDPIICAPFVVPSGFLSRDGVYPSDSGWRALLAAIRARL